MTEQAGHAGGVEPAAPVVIGYDGSSSGEDALALGLWTSRALDAPPVVAVVHPSPAPISPARVDAEWVADRHRLAERIIESARALVHSDPAGSGATYRIVGSSSAAHGLHDLAEELDAGVIVVGSHSSGPQERLFAGSTAERLLSGSPCPIGVAPTGWRKRRPGELARIGVAYLDTPEARAALAIAARLAERTSASLRLFTVVADRADVMPLFIGMDAERVYWQEAKEEFRLSLDTAIAGLPPGVAATGDVLSGRVVDVLAELDEKDIDLLFCGSRGYGPARRILLGGVSSKLVRTARSPVIVVPRGD
jgi:nucleotide-binding universal stress UspA family protein